MFIDLIKSKKVKANRSTVIRDRPIKSILKAISWRVIGTIDTMFIAFIITGKPIMAVSIGSIEVFTKIALYYFHERAWELIRWGRMLVIIRRSQRNARKSITRIFIKNTDTLKEAIEQ